MKKQTTQTRQHIGCGYELTQIKPKPWTPENMDPMWRPFHKDFDITVCPGYTMNLPEAREISRARLHAKELGGLRDFCDDTPTDRLREGVEVLEGANNEMHRWSMDNAEKK
jgi:hypothetical protein